MTKFPACLIIIMALVREYVMAGGDSHQRESIEAEEVGMRVLVFKKGPSGYTAIVVPEGVGSLPAVTVRGTDKAAVLQEIDTVVKAVKGAPALSTGA